VAINGFLKIRKRNLKPALNADLYTGILQENKYITSKMDYNITISIILSLISSSLIYLIFWIFARRIYHEKK
jgi:hypothetical protein